MTVREMIKNEMLIEFWEGCDCNYKTDDGRIIRRVYCGKRGTTMKWEVEGIDFLYRSLFEAYNDCRF